MCMSLLKSGIGKWWPVATTVGEDCSFLDLFYGAYTIQKQHGNCEVTRTYRKKLLRNLLKCKSSMVTTSEFKTIMIKNFKSKPVHPYSDLPAA